MSNRVLSIFVITFAGLASASLSGCQNSCTGDPRFDNYWCARSNINDGTYSRQTAQLRTTAADRQMQAATLRSRLDARQAQLSAARSQNSSATEISRLEGEISSLRQQISYLSR
jgi:hypothetical protein